MAPTAVCPDETALRRLALGQLAEEEAAPLEGHLAGCDRCAAALQALPVGDSLVWGLQEARAAAPLPEGERIEGLARRLQELRPDPASGPEEPPARLGDFRIVREVGRGGMGVVYEAEQVSLGRRVALKVLPFASTLDPRQLRRFRNEAQAVAQLHHTNIVPVYFVGCERGVHFYAMQYVEGRTLAALVAELRRQTGRDAAPDGGLPATVSELTGPTRAGDTSVDPAGPGSDVRSVGSSSFFRAVARLGVQAAGALEHAHELGIIHRDVKPANLLVEQAPASPGDEDGAGGLRLWVTDFGLAHCRGQAGLTVTGDLVGTLRYMSPEQALARRGLVDHRTDVYALGATLYELLTLEPVFPGRDRQELLRQIAVEEPAPPRRLNKAVPRELETIVLKALEKDPANRYATAGELADDLGRFLKDEPIQARRPTWPLRARKWARRHRPVVAAAAVVLAVAGLLGAGEGWRLLRQRAATAEQVGLALREAAVLQEQQKWREALAAFRRAETVLASGGGDAGLHRRVQELGRELQMAVRLEDLRVQKDYYDNAGFKVGNARAAGAYAGAFAEYGIDVLGDPPGQAAAAIRARGIREQLVAALDDWLLVPDARVRARVRAVAELTDPDPWRNRMRQAVVANDRRALEELADRPEVADLPPASAYLLAQGLANVGAGPKAVRVLAAVQRRHPQDFWLNFQMGCQLLWGPGVEHRADNAAGFFRAALVAHPDDPVVYLYLALALGPREHADEVVALNRKAIELAPTYVDAHFNLGNALRAQGKPAEAEAEYREAVRLRPDDPDAHVNLAGALQEQGKPAEAEAECRAALRLRSDLPEAHLNLGAALRDRGKLAEAEAELRAALRLRPDFAEAHNNLSIVLRDRDKHAEAEAEGRATVRLRPDLPEGHFNLGNALLVRGKHAEAEAEYREALRLRPDYADAHVNLGAVLQEQGKSAEAEAAYRQALRLRPEFPQSHLDLGSFLYRQRKFAEAETEFRQALGRLPGYPEAHFDLGNALKAQGKRAEAAAEFREVVRLRPGFAEGHVNLGALLSDEGKSAEAEAAYRAAVRVRPDLPEAHLNLGTLLGRQGRFAEALEAFRRCHEFGSRRLGWSYPSAQWVRDTEQLVALDAKLSRVLQGSAEPAGAAERLALAGLCQQYKQRYASAARFYAEAFAAEAKQADDPRGGHRYNAARAAVLAGCGQGVDAAQLDHAERARLRKQALTWLRADLTAWGQLLDKQPQQTRAAPAQALRHWQQDAGLAGVRGDALDRLPRAERPPWRRLWADVEQTLSEADRNDTRDTKKNPPGR